MLGHCTNCMLITAKLRWARILDKCPSAKPDPMPGHLPKDILIGKFVTSFLRVFDMTWHESDYLGGKKFGKLFCQHFELYWSGSNSNHLIEHAVFTQI